MFTRRVPGSSRLLGTTGEVIDRRRAPFIPSGNQVGRAATLGRVVKLSAVVSADGVYHCYIVLREASVFYQFKGHLQFCATKSASVEMSVLGHFRIEEVVYYVWWPMYLT